MKNNSSSLFMSDRGAWNQQELSPEREDLKDFITLDQKLFFDQLTPQLLNSGTLFDLHHQTILRLYQEEIESGSENNQVVERYAVDGDFRSLVYTIVGNDVSKRWQKAMPRLSAIESKLLHSPLPFKLGGGFSYATPAHALVSECFSVTASQLGKTKGVAFYAPGAFAYFPSAVDSGIADFIKTVEDCRTASVGARMYYGFNLEPGGDSFLLAPSIRTLADAVSVHAHIDASMFDYSGLRSPMLASAHELLEAVDHNMERLTQVLTRVFAMHELGHRPFCEGNVYLKEAMLAAGVPTEAVYDPSFPSLDQLGTWDTVRLGLGTPEAVTFLIGDYLANLAALQMGLHEPERKFMELFNWWLLRKPVLTNRPRGVGPLLRFLQDRDVGRVQDQLTVLLKASLDAPKTLAEKFYQFEDSAWNWLAQRWPIIEHGR
jgi:hypothetical protein